MDGIVEYIFSQFKDYPSWAIYVEAIAVLFSVVSVIFSLRNSIYVFPTGIVATALYVALLYHWNLLGDMLINAYYFSMSMYGWYIWTRPAQSRPVTPISNTSSRQWVYAAGIAVASAVGIYVLYAYYDRIEDYRSYVDMGTTGIFFAGMWLMALRKTEHWLVLLIGNVISVPLYFSKGLIFSSLLFCFLAIIAAVGYRRWIHYLNSQNLEVNV